MNASARSLLSLVLLAVVASGCATMPGGPAGTALSRRDEPSVVLCMSERTRDGGLRLVGRLETGLYPATGATLQYRIASPSDPVPAVVERGEFELSGARTEKTPVRRGAEEVSFTIAPQAARKLEGSVLWYRWTLGYDRGGAQRTTRTAVHRTSLEEAGLPRDAFTAGPDTSVAPAATRRR